LDSALLAKSAEDIRAGRWGTIHAFLVFRSGRLAHEAYFAGQDEIWFEGYRYVEYGPTIKHDLRSVSKSFTSTLVGIAIDQGLIDSVDMPLRRLLPDYAELLTGAKTALTLRHVLTMSAGLRWAEGGKVENDADDDQYDLQNAEDPVEIVLARESVAPPGAEYNYSGGLTQVLAAVVERAAGQPLLEYADSVLFSPLGIHDWEWFALGNARPAAWVGLKLTARDVAKLGQVYLDGGQWHGRRIVSADWIDAALSPGIDRPAPGAPSYVSFTGYGFQWWYDVHEWNGRSIQVHSAIGSGGQRIIVLPDFDIVVAVFAGFYQEPGNGWTPEAMVREYIFPNLADPA
jgi:CubicO group peptidase (beta-lactamase class C family)